MLFWKYLISQTCTPEPYLTLQLCINQVEPMNRALKEQNSDSWINGRRRDHGIFALWMIFFIISFVYFSPVTFGFWGVSRMVYCEPIH